MQLSVILPNFQHGHVISRALDALQSQERKPDEIIVVDDASTDGSVAVIEQAVARSGNIRLLANDSNRGAIASLRRGLDDARGGYIYFAAADDWVMPRFFALAIEMLDANPRAGLFCGDAVLVDAETKRCLGVRPPVMPMARAGYIDPAAASALLARSDNWILTGSAVFRRTAVADAGGLDPELGSFADGFLARKVALMCGFCYAPQVVATWCVDPNGLSRSAALDAERAGRLLASVTSKIAADAVFPPWYVQRFADRWRFSSARLALQERPRNDDVVMVMGARSKLDRSVLSLALAAPRPSARQLRHAGVALATLPPLPPDRPAPYRRPSPPRTGAWRSCFFCPDKATHVTSDAAQSDSAPAAPIADVADHFIRDAGVREPLGRDLYQGLEQWPLWTMLGWSDIHQRYRRSTLGPFWITLSTGIFIVVLGVIYGRIFKMEIATYLPYFAVGYILWGFISSTTIDCCTAFIESERIIKQIKRPFSAYVLRVVYRNIVIFLHTAIIFIPLLLVFHREAGSSVGAGQPRLALVVPIRSGSTSWSQSEQPLSRRATNGVDGRTDFPVRHADHVARRALGDAASSRT